MRISTLQLYQQGVNAMLDRQAELAKTQLQMATGKRVLAPSDDPTASTRVLKLSQLIDMNTQYQRNADAAQTRLSLEDSVLSQTGDLLQRVRELAVQAGNSTLTANDRAAIAVEVRTRLDELLQASNSKQANGKYLFAGYQTTTKPFNDAGGGSYSYAGDQGQQMLQIGPTRKLASADPGSKVFMQVDNGAGGVDSMFAVLADFATALEANTTPTTTLSRLDSAINQVLSTRASIGARLNTIDTQKSINDTFDLQLQKNRSSLADLDYAKAASRLQRQSLALQASQQSFIKIQSLSLFKYL